jgi:hypothetical protein
MRRTWAMCSRPQTAEMLHVRLQYMKNRILIPAFLLGVIGLVGLGLLLKADRRMDDRTIGMRNIFHSINYGLDPNTH